LSVGNVIIRYNKRKETKMLATAIALQQATQEAVHDETVMEMAGAIYQNKDAMTGDEFIRALYLYSAHLSALTTTLATHALLTESQIDEMMSSVNEFEQIGKDIINGND
jgi:predicted NAD/FAD-dependent oxidoreductase